MEHTVKSSLFVNCAVTRCISRVASTQATHVASRSQVRQSDGQRPYRHSAAPGIRWTPVHGNRCRSGYLIDWVTNRSIEVDRTVKRRLLDEWQQHGVHAPARSRLRDPVVGLPRPSPSHSGNEPRRKRPERRLVIVKCQSHLPQVVGATHPSCSFARCLHRRKQKSDQNPNDRDHHQQLH